MVLGIALSCTCTPKANPDTGKDSIPVSGVSISRTAISVRVGDTFKLAAKVEPYNAGNQTVSWSTANPELVRIDTQSGAAQALAEGTAAVTVTTQEGAFTASCTVTISPAAQQTDPTPNPPDPGPGDPGAPAAFGAVPTAGQLAWQRQELLMFYHYGQATFSGWDGENGTCNGKPWSESLLLENYAPTTINADQWVKTAADNGFKEVILTAKHHDGFCLWDNPESTTDVANDACKNHTDVVQAVRDACNKYGVNMGIYLSPWDRMIEVSGKSTTQYETMYKNALKNLMTKYAPVVEMWFDGNHAGNFNWESVNQVVLTGAPSTSKAAA